MTKKTPAARWARTFARSIGAFARTQARAGGRAVDRALKKSLPSALDKQRPPPGAGEWIAGVAVGAAGMRRFRLYRPPAVRSDERLPLLVMLHGCGQDARGFAAATRMNRIADRERFLVLYPEQDRMANAQGCWNWFDTQSGRAQGEVALVMKALDQVCLLYPVDRQRVALAGLSAGASLAALLAVRHPDRFKALVMHSGVPPGTAHSTASALVAMQGDRITPALQAPAASTSAAWPPLLVIHGSADTVVSASNAQAAVRVWAEAGAASAAPVRTMQRGARHPMSVTDFRRRGSTVASLVEVHALGHAWSGGAAGQRFSDPLGPDASRLAWAFVARQFRSSPSNDRRADAGVVPIPA